MANLPIILIKQLHHSNLYYWQMASLKGIDNDHTWVRYTSGRSMDWERKNVSRLQLKKWLFLTFWMDTSNARNKNLRPLFNTNIPPISGKYGLRNHFWSLESGFLMRKREENDFFLKIRSTPDFELLDSECPYYHLPISKKIHRETFFLSQCMLLPLVYRDSDFDLN